MIGRPIYFDRAADCERLMDTASDRTKGKTSKLFRDMWIMLANESETTSALPLLITESARVLLQLTAPEHRRASRAGRQRIADRYAAGETMAELAREYECSEPTVWCVLQGPFDASAAA